MTTTSVLWERVSRGLSGDAAPGARASFRAPAEQTTPSLVIKRSFQCLRYVSSQFDVLFLGHSVSHGAAHAKQERFPTLARQHSRLL